MSRPVWASRDVRTVLIVVAAAAVGAVALGAAVVAIALTAGGVL